MRILVIVFRQNTKILNTVLFINGFSDFYFSLLQGYNGLDGRKGEPGEAGAKVHLMMIIQNRRTK